MKKPFLFLISLLFVFVSCAKDRKDVVITIHTLYGDMKVILYEETPLHKANFIQLAKESQYDSTIFHRVIENFMVQGGNIETKTGVSSSETIPAEIVNKFYHQKGALSAARQGDASNPKKASSWCQFYIVHGKTFKREELTVNQQKLSQAISQLIKYDSHKDIKEKFMALQEKGDFEALNKLALEYIDLSEKYLNIKLRKDITPKRLKVYTETGGTPHLDGAYTVFGKVVEGIEVIDLIAKVKTGQADKPIEDIYMSMEVERISKKKITKRYGYEYPKK